MSITWQESSTYFSNPQGTDNTGGGSLRQYGMQLPGAAQITGLTIAAGTVVDSPSGTFYATVNFAPGVVSVSGVGALSSVTVVLQYYGYQTYYPLTASGSTDFNSPRHAALFSVIGAGNPVTLQDGSTSSVPDWAMPNLRSIVSTAFSEGGGVCALLPTNVKNYSVSMQDTGPHKGELLSETVIVCFLANTMIATPAGDVAVENLTAGDSVLVWKGGQWIPQNVTRIVRTLVKAPATSCPVVCVKAGALAENVPNKDLYITEEHCLFEEGRLIPARMLVNGVTITTEQGLDPFWVYHVECEDHVILCADGALAESYLDTSHRISRESNLIQLGSKSWTKDAAAPLCVERELVEPTWYRIALRAGMTRFEVETTCDPQLTLECGGRIVEPYRVAGGNYLFSVPDHVDHGYLLSRASSPADAIGAFVDDRRQLGVLVGDVHLFSPDQTRRLDVSSRASSAIGWHAPEQDGARWTNGRALLAFGDPAPNRIVAVHIRHAGPYLVSDDRPSSHTAMMLRDVA